MIDENDFDFVLWAFWPTSLPGLIVWLVALGIVGFLWFSNEKECAQMACPEGQYAELLEGNCLCVSGQAR